MNNIRFFLTQAFIFARIIKIYFVVFGIKLAPVYAIVVNQEGKLVV